MTTRILAFALSVLTLGFGLAFSTVSIAADSSTTASAVTAEQARLAKDLPQTVVVRTNTQTGETTVLESQSILPMNEAGKAAVQQLAGEFRAVPKTGADEMSEVSSTSSWYAYFNPGWGFAPTYRYYGYSYSYYPCYSYNWGSYFYSWYSWRW